MSSPSRHRPARRQRGGGRPRNSAGLVEARKSAELCLTFPPELPVSAAREEIAAAVRDHQVVVIAGETGSGKTTQIPKILMGLGRGIDGIIGHTQPRRLAARTVAERIAAEVGTEVGAGIGYQVRFTATTTPSTRVKVMTDGILLAEIQHDPMLSAYDTLVIDEAHERSLNIDFLIGYLATLLPKRPDLKLIITSATINPGEFSRHFGEAPIIEVSGRTYPVDIRYRPLAAEDSSEDEDGEDIVSQDRDLTEGILAAVDELIAEPDGDILVFLSGERDIRDTRDALEGHLRKRGARAANYEVVPLFARLSSAEQHRIFEAHARPHIVLATNIAETSLTVPGIKYVIDSGLARISRYSHRTKVQRLPIEAISQASAAQRAGRSGRTSPGICIRLYGEADFGNRPEYTDPEILRTNLANVILQMAGLGLASSDEDIASFPFLTAPDGRAVRDGRVLLGELGALAPTKDGGNRLTRLGRKIGRLPVDPRFARMLLEGVERGVAAEMTVVVAALTIQDPRERPLEKRAEATGLHRRFEDPTSDFMSLLNLWNYVAGLQDQLGTSARRRRLRGEFLNVVRLREWQDLVRQLRSLLRDQDVTVGELRYTSAEPGEGIDRQAVESLLAEAVHRSVLSGLLSQIGARRVESKEYLGARGSRFQIFPGSGLFRKPPALVMSAELVETSRLWARVNARILGEWVEDAAGPLAKRQYSEPHWSSRSGSVMAHERVTLYGVPLIADRRVGYAAIDPELSRELFIRRALVEGDWKTRHRFAARNRETLRRVEELGSRTRSFGVVDDDIAFEFFDARIPADVTSAAHFDRWFKTASAADPALLDITEDLFLDDEELEAQEADFPLVWPLPGGGEARLSYQFLPGQAADGLTIHLPLAELAHVPSEEFGWLVPGLRADLGTALIRSLPKNLRRNFVPAPDVAARVLAEVEPYRGELTEALATALSADGGSDGQTRVAASDFDLTKLPEHLRPRFEVVDERGRPLGGGQDFEELRRRLAPQVRTTVRAAAAALERRGLTDWDFGTLDETFAAPSSGPQHSRVRGVPALVDRGESVDLVVLPTAEEAAAASWAGTRRLLRLGVPDPSGYVSSHLTTQEKLRFAAHQGGVKVILDDVVDAAIDHLMLENGAEPSGAPVRDSDDFVSLRAAVRDRLQETVFEGVKIVADVLAAAADARKAVSQNSSLVILPQLQDVSDHVARLTGDRFVTTSGWEHLRELPRYLRADVLRVGKLPANPARDKSLMDRVHAEEAAIAAAAKLRPRAAELRWLAEELRVSLFAQELGTAGPVSEKRIRKALAETL